MKAYLPVILCLVLTASLRAQTLAQPTPDGSSKGVCRIGISYASFGKVSPNDAKAALKVWASTAAKERKLEMEFQIEVFDKLSDLRDGLSQGRLEGASMTAEEFIESGQRPEHIFLTAKEKSYTERYVLLVHSGESIKTLADLRGRRLVRHYGARTSPALPWLETVLAAQGLGRAENLFGQVAALESPSKSVLQVFFGQADAGLVSAEAYEVACELNPQLKQELKVLAISPELIPTLFAFRDAYQSADRARVEAALVELGKTTAGQQVLTVFQCSKMERHPVSCFEPTRQLFAEYHQICGGASAVTQSAQVK